MNLVQLAEHAKNLSNEQLQKMLQQPDGSVPPFILASEAARRQDIERSAQMQPSQPTTVLDDLIQSRAEKAGVNQLAGQVAQPQPTPQAPPQMRDGGPVRRFFGGGLSDLETPSYNETGGFNFSETPAPDPFGAGLSNSLNWIYQKWNPTGAPSPFSGVSAGEDAEEAAGIDALSPEESAQDLARYNRMANFNPATPKISPVTTPTTGPGAVDPEAADKLKESADKEKEMGVETPSAVANPTTGNSVDSSVNRAKLEALFSGEDNEYFLGIAPTGYAAASQAMFNNDPGTSTGERIANAAMALAASQQDAEESQRRLQREGALALLNYDMKEADRAREDQIREIGYAREDKRYQQALDAQAAKDLRAEKAASSAAYLDGIKTQSDTYKVMSDRAGKDMENIAQKYQGNPLGIKAWTPEDIQRYKELESAQKSYYGQYIYFQNELSKSKGVKFKVSETIDPVTGRPIPMPPP